MINPQDGWETLKILIYRQLDGGNLILNVNTEWVGSTPKQSCYPSDIKIMETALLVNS